MVYYEDRCCDCTAAAYPCTFCGLRHYKVVECDCCGEEVDRLFDVDGRQVCIECAKKILPYDEESDCYDVGGVWVSWDVLDEVLLEVDLYDV